MDFTDVIIQGITANGKPFRPSDWAERLCGVVGVFEPAQQKLYAPLVRQADINGIKCVVVNGKLEQMEPRFFRFLLDFAHDNELQVKLKPHASPTAAPAQSGAMASSSPAPTEPARASPDPAAAASSGASPAATPAAASVKSSAASAGKVA